ncbi:MAG: metal dependent phosphohydrolase [Candidatus Saccharibacteria bacterium]|nr:metal dependent phosphohydrolase [Candidatus Saccharibacteria bacterium]
MSRSERHSVKTDIQRMPLIEVTGEESTGILEQRLQDDLNEIGLIDNELVQNSIRLALSLHEGQKRTYELYVNHVLRVTIRLIEQFGITDPDIIAAAVLHDSLEDKADKLIQHQSPETPIPVDPRIKRAMGHQALQQFASSYGENDVADLVFELSILPVSSSSTRAAKIQAYLGYTARIMETGDARARIIKHADFIDNTHTPLELENKHKRAQLDPKQIGAYALHIAGLEREDSLVIGKIREEIIEILKQLEAEALERMDARSGLGEIGGLGSLLSA